jgi:selenocysteine lyase/cysteine desulfurase
LRFRAKKPPRPSFDPLSASHFRGATAARRIARVVVVANDARASNPAARKSAGAYCSLRAPVVRDERPEETLFAGSAADDDDDDALCSRSSPVVRDPPLSLDQVRAMFPAVSVPRFSLGYAFFENAGGSQVPALVADAVRARMVRAHAQLGAGYIHADRADACADAAHAVVRAVMGVRAGDGDVALGPSTSQLLANLARAFEGSASLAPGDEIVIQRASHEANVSPWTRLADRVGCDVVWWNDADATWDGWEDDTTTTTTTTMMTTGNASKTHALDALRAAVTPRTKIVAACAVSNILGGVVDVPALVRVVRERAHPSCRVVLDAVAYAPHRLVSVAEWGVDWCAFSPYKTFGPHCGALYGREDAFAEVAESGPNHYFVDPAARAYKFELGGVAHEACAGLVGMGAYLRALSGRRAGVGTRTEGEEEEEEEEEEAVDLDLAPPTREDVVVAFERVVELEREPQRALVAILTALEDEGLIAIHGPRTADQAARVPTAAFSPTKKSAADVVAAVRAPPYKIAMRSGHMYAVRLLEDLGLDPNVGVVRVSLAHYNTTEEVARFGEALGAALRGE